MPTNEERREAARRLRELAPGSDWPRYVAEACGMDVSKMSNHFHTYTAQLCQRLADLIDPEPEQACHPVMMSWSGNPPYHKGSVSLDALTIGCSECGCPWNTTITRLPNYCHNCGAKVIRESTNTMYDDAC